MEQEVLSFLQALTPKLCVLSTVTKDGKPESAVVGFAVQEDLSIILSTTKRTRKYQNLTTNTNVSLIFGWSFTQKNVQYEGKAILIEEGDLYIPTEKFFFEQNPDAAKFKSEDTIFIKITPIWIRLLDHTVTPPTLFEKTV